VDAERSRVERPYNARGNVYVALATGLADQPAATAIALSVVVLTTRTPSVYRVADVVGVLPSVV
jgi:hypothetical protein